MNFSIIFTMVKRYLRIMRHDLNNAAEVFYEPILQILIWGITSIYIKNAAPNLPLIVNVFLTGIVFWTVIINAQYAISISLMYELWDKNIVNIFVSPLRIREWISAILIVGIIKTSLSLVFAVIISFILYKINLFSYGILLVPFIFNLIMTGWGVGFFVSSLVVRFGQRLGSISWTAVGILAPFSAVYFPVTTLPLWAQKISAFVPTSYIFEGMRQIIFTGRLSYDKLIISFILNLIYLTIGIACFIFMFNKSRKLGLSRLIQ